MSQPQTYKDRTVEVRNSARAHLKTLRQERISRRKASLLSDRATDAQYGLDGDGPSFEAPQNSSDFGDTPMSDDVPPLGGDAASDVPIVERAGALETDARDDDLHDLAVENVAMSEMGGDAASAADVCNEGPVTDGDADTDSQHTADLSLADTDKTMPATDPSIDVGETLQEEQTTSDLETLPGAGPGLVWMLNECGVQTLSDLAQKTPDQLTAELGVVGQILDVSQWIKFAQDASV